MSDSTDRSPSSKVFDNRIALVTGGSRGIGAACCRTLAAAGAHVIVHYQTQTALAAEVCEQIESVGGSCQHMAADISREDSVNELVKSITDQHGRIDLLVNNAGILHSGDLDSVTPEVWKRIIEVNLTGTYLVTWAVKSLMISNNYGRIVNMASIAGLRARPTAIPYAASKAAVISLTRSLATALADYDIRVNAVAPGLIATEMIDEFPDELIDGLIQATPMKRLGTTEEIAAVVKFLLSDDSRFMTGQTIVASGGRVHS